MQEVNCEDREVMSRDPACCVLSDSAQTVAKILCNRNLGSMPVVADQQSLKLVGMITDRDMCCAVIPQAWIQKPQKSQALSAWLRLRAATEKISRPANV
jgi:CBS-domain-containing membrane protein